MSCALLRITRYDLQQFQRFNEVARDFCDFKPKTREMYDVYARWRNRTVCASTVVRFLVSPLERECQALGRSAREKFSSSTRRARNVPPGMRNLSPIRNTIPLSQIHFVVSHKPGWEDVLSLSLAMYLSLIYPANTSPSVPEHSRPVSPDISAGSQFTHWLTSWSAGDTQRISIEIFERDGGCVV